jgi:hypothetical protein
MFKVIAKFAMMLFIPNGIKDVMKGFVENNNEYRRGMIKIISMLGRIFHNKIVEDIKIQKQNFQCGRIFYICVRIFRDLGVS